MPVTLASTDAWAEAAQQIVAIAAAARRLRISATLTQLRLDCN
jgi:hypothetical protein